MVFCSQCHGSGKDEGGKAPCQKCGGFGLLIRNENAGSTILWGDSVGLRREGDSSEDGQMKEICCSGCGNDGNYELVKCLTARKYRVKCRVCGHVFVINRKKDELAELNSKC
jgi:RecJ-like exonuclease